jgi:hypothetical protein
MESTKLSKLNAISEGRLNEGTQHTAIRHEPTISNYDPKQAHRTKIRKASKWMDVAYQSALAFRSRSFSLSAPEINERDKTLKRE